MTIDVPFELGTAADFLGVGVTALLGIAGMYLAHSVRRRTEAEIAAKVSDRRLDAYASLWTVMKDASPMRDVTNERPLRPRDRKRLFDALNRWYYENGNGMVLSEVSRNVFLTAEVNLICEVERLRPSSLQERVRSSPDPDRIRGRASIRQLSLLRTSLRADLLLYARPWGEHLSAEDLAFLRESGVDPNDARWRIEPRAARRPLGSSDRRHWLATDGRK